jgi:phosphohistidine phosphatase
MKTLYVVRHAKSSWEQEELKDFDRPLTDRGIKNAPEMAVRILTNGAAPQLLLSSPAKRAISTARLMAIAFKLPEEKIKQDSSIYEAERNDLSRLISRQDPDIDTILLVGHNPGVSDYINWLCGTEEAQIPTCAVARIRVNSNRWNGWEKGMGKLEDLDFPKKKQ